MKTSNALITAAVIGFLFWLFSRKRAIASNPFLLKTDWSNGNIVVEYKNLGKFTITKNAWSTAPQGHYTKLKNNAGIELGWTTVLPNVVAITAVHSTGAMFSEAYVVNFNTKTAEFFSKYNEVIAQG